MVLVVIPSSLRKVLLPPRWTVDAGELWRIVHSCLMPFDMFRALEAGITVGYTTCMLAAARAFELRVRELLSEFLLRANRVGSFLELGLSTA